MTIIELIQDHSGITATITAVSAAALGWYTKKRQSDTEAQKAKDNADIEKRKAAKEENESAFAMMKEVAEDLNLKWSESNKQIEVIEARYKEDIDKMAADMRRTMDEIREEHEAEIKKLGEEHNKAMASSLGKAQFLQKKIHALKTILFQESVENRLEEKDKLAIQSVLDCIDGEICELLGTSEHKEE